MRRLIGMINGILPFFAAMLIQYCILSLLGIGIRTLPVFHAHASEAVYYAGIIAAFLCGLIFFFWYMDTVHYRKLIIPRQMLQGPNILLLACLGLSAQFAISGMMSFLQPLLIDLFRDYDQVIGTILNHNLFAVLIYVILIAPVTEELIFRGVILSKLEEALPFFGANLIQAATFGIYHWNIVQGVYAFGIGLLLGFIAHRFRSLTASVLLHMAINGSAFLVTMVPATKAVIIPVTAVGALAMIGFIYIIHRRTVRSVKEE